jgi:hypothetical protein
MHVLIKWTKREFLRRRVMPVPLFVGGVVLWFFSEAISGWAGYGVKQEYVQLIALFLLAIAVQGWGVSPLHVPSTPQVK